MDYKEALEYINGVSWLGSKPGLERVRELLERLGRPQDGQRYIHIAGTNGKGSCAALLSSVLKLSLIHISPGSPARRACAGTRSCPSPLPAA